MPSEITSIHNPKIKQWSQLLTKRARESQGQFLLEGVHLIQEALQAGIHIHTILYSLEKKFPVELSRMTSLVTEWIGVSEAVLTKCSDTQTPQGVVAVTEKLKWTLQSFMEKENGLVIAIDGVQDPGNLGTIIRSADAVGATGIILGRGTVDLYNSKTVRATMGSMFHLPIVEGDLVELLPEASKQGIQLISASLTANRSCYEVDMTGATWFIVGNEGSGISAEIESLVSQKVIIPMPGRAESLNVAMAATVLLFEAARQRLV